MKNLYSTLLFLLASTLCFAQPSITLPAGKKWVKVGTGKHFSPAVDPGSADDAKAAGSVAPYNGVPFVNGGNFAAEDGMATFDMSIANQALWGARTGSAGPNQVPGPGLGCNNYDTSYGLNLQCPEVEANNAYYQASGGALKSDVTQGCPFIQDQLFGNCGGSCGENIAGGAENEEGLAYADYTGTCNNTKNSGDNFPKSSTQVRKVVLKEWLNDKPVSGANNSSPAGTIVKLPTKSTVNFLDNGVGNGTGVGGDEARLIVIGGTSGQQTSYRISATFKENISIDGGFNIVDEEIIDFAMSNNNYTYNNAGSTNGNANSYQPKNNNEPIDWAAQEGQGYTGAREIATGIREDGEELTVNFSSKSEIKLERNSGDADGRATIGPGMGGKANLITEYDIWEIQSIVSIGSTVFFDANNDGVQSGVNEIGLENVVVNIIYLGADNAEGGGDDQIFPVTTGTNGLYYKDDLPEGKYIVQIPNSPMGYPISSSITDNTDNIDSNDDGIQITSGGVTRSAIIDLVAGDELVGEAGTGGTLDDAADSNGNMTVDFGFTSTVSIGSSIWNDANNDGKQGDAMDEPGLSGVEVTITYLGTDGVVGGGDDEEFTVTTDASGNYYKNDLLPGNYVVSVDSPPAGFPVASTSASTTDDNEDGVNDGSQSTVGGASTSPIITLTAGGEPENETFSGGNQDSAEDSNGNMTIDFGFYNLTQLAVDLIRFDARNTLVGVNLIWETANEENFDRFEIEKSTNLNKEFAVIGKIFGGKSNYNFIDTNQSKGSAYYRLKMVDLDGTFEYSKIKSVFIEYGLGEHSVYPNPAKNGEFNLKNYFEINTYSVFDQLGNKVPTKMTKTTDEYSFKIEAKAGIYILKYNVERKSYSQKVFVK